MKCKYILLYLHKLSNDDNMKVFVLITQKPLKVKTYTSLAALVDDNILPVSKSKLEKWDFIFDYADSKIVISRTEAKTTGDVRRQEKEI